METLEINIGDFNGSIKRLPKNMKEMADVIYGILQRHEIMMEHGKKEIEIYIVNHQKIWKNGK